MSQSSTRVPALSDKALMEMSDEEIHKATGEFSYDIKQCRKRLKADGNWNKVIQAHLFYDHVLTKIIEEGLTRPKHLSLERMTFAAKADLAAALGLVSDVEKGFLRAVNNLRNSIAHDLQFVVTRNHATELYKMMPTEFREIVDDTRKQDKGTLLFAALLVFAVLLDITRQRQAAVRLHERKGRLRLAAAMENARKVLDDTDPSRRRPGPIGTTAPR